MTWWKRFDDTLRAHPYITGVLIGLVAVAAALLLAAAGPATPELFGAVCMLVSLVLLVLSR